MRSRWSVLCLLVCAPLGCSETTETSGVGAGGFGAGGSAGAASAGECSDPFPTTSCSQWFCVSGDYVCVDDAPPQEMPAGCGYLGLFREVGTMFAAGDGCNTCECSSTLNVVCTEIACDAGTLLDGGVTPLDGGVTPLDGGDASPVDASLRDAESD